MFDFQAFGIFLLDFWRLFGEIILFTTHYNLDMMYGWLKYVAFGIIALLAICFLYDIIKNAVRKGGNWKTILLRIIIWLIVIAITIAINVWLNRNWVANKWIFTIRPTIDL